jgi:hypothetical protein
MRGSRSSILIEDIAHAEGVDLLMFAHLVGDGLCLPLSCVDMSFAAEQLVRALKRLMSNHDKPIVGTLEFLKRNECRDFSKWSPPGGGPCRNMSLQSTPDSDETAILLVFFHPRWRDSRTP